VKQPPTNPSDIGRLADEFIAQDAANAERGGKLPGGKLPGSSTGGRGGKDPGGSTGPRIGKGSGVGVPGVGVPGVGAPIVGGSSRASKGSPDRPRKGMVPLPLPGPLAPPPPPAGSPFGTRTIGLLLGLLAIIVLVVGGLVLLAGKPSTTVGARPSSGLASPVSSTAAQSPALGSPGSSASATTLPGVPSGPPSTTPTPLPIPPTPLPLPNPTPQPRPTPHPPTTIIAFKAQPTKVAGDCKSGLTAFALKLDNSGSNVAVNWSVAFVANPALKGDWGTAKPASGQVAAGAVTTTTITPQNLCPSMKSQTSFTLDVNAGKGGTTGVTYTVTP
jgi:hypothetical protein